ncbi:hypothetical protein FXV83_39715 [Bradyrhizobium hipponense]|uniref:Uncharacterized protein n=1 Tax=Bradyrhizobium hipponense TaxID=2605638 RepID=A0A5S4YBT5_9BRAD|nr:hypothetical protein FXV83_39715 [Bradyrhizobium hipponense]
MLNDTVQTAQIEKVAVGLVFTEGPLWDPDGCVYFVDLRSNVLCRMVLGEKPTKVRDTVGGNGCTFDLQGRLVNCEGGLRRAYRIENAVSPLQIQIIAFPCRSVRWAMVPSIASRPMVRSEKWPSSNIRMA